MLREILRVNFSAVPQSPGVCSDVYTGSSYEHLVRKFGNNITEVLSI
jgi:hypothetical protein